MIPMNRREFLRRSFVAAGGVSVAAPLLALASCTDAVGPDDGEAGGGRRLQGVGELTLPAGFSYRVLSREGEVMSDGSPTPTRFDGMGAFAGPAGATILIRNHENRGQPVEIGVRVPEDKRYDAHEDSNGGNTRLVVSADRRLVESHAVLGGTTRNCAGGTTPWGTWVTCEEEFDDGGMPHGYIFEVDASATGPVDPAPIRSAGRLVHEAVAWDDGVLYATEDRSDAAFYRVVFDTPPSAPGDLARAPGRLQALRIIGEEYFGVDTDKEWPVGTKFPVDWVTIGNPEPDDDDVRLQAHDLGAAVFSREEGAWAGNGRIYFDCTSGGRAGEGQVWEFDPRAQALTLIYESPGREQLHRPDNIVVGPTGDLFLCEDNDSGVHIRRLSPDGRIFEFARVTANESEFCGACFDPSGRTLFVNQQGDDDGTEAVTYAIWGPWHELGSTKSL